MSEEKGFFIKERKKEVSIIETRRSNCWFYFHFMGDIFF